MIPGTFKESTLTQSSTPIELRNLLAHPLTPPAPPAGGEGEETRVAGFRE